MRISNRQLKIALLFLAAVSLIVWEGFVYYAAKHPLPAGTCVSGYGECPGGPTMWGNVVWGSLGLFVVLVPGWIVTLMAIGLSHYVSSHRSGRKTSAKS
jgi:hypothetical protein